MSNKDSIKKMKTWLSENDTKFDIVQGGYSVGPFSTGTHDNTDKVDALGYAVGGYISPGYDFLSKKGEYSSYDNQVKYGVVADGPEPTIKDQVQVSMYEDKKMNCHVFQVMYTGLVAKQMVSNELMDQSTPQVLHEISKMLAKELQAPATTAIIYSSLKTLTQSNYNPFSSMYQAHLAIPSLSSPSPSLGASHLPGIQEYARHPINGQSDSLYAIIIDLNDLEKWTRDKIADWIETLDIDTTFKTKEIE